MHPWLGTAPLARKKSGSASGRGVEAHDLDFLDAEHRPGRTLGGHELIDLQPNDPNSERGANEPAKDLQSAQFSVRSPSMPEKSKALRVTRIALFSRVTAAIFKSLVPILRWSRRS